MSNFELGQVVPGADFCPAMVRYSVPIKDELEQIEGVLIVNMWGQRVDSTMEAALGGYPGNAYIVEVSENTQRDGIYLYHKDSSKRFANQVGSKHRLSNGSKPVNQMIMVRFIKMTVECFFIVKYSHIQTKIHSGLLLLK